MVSLPSRTVTALAGLALSLAVSALAWVYFDTFLLFLFLPFVPFLFARGGKGDSGERPPVRRCPRCEFETREESFQYCPRDGARLERER